MLRHDLSAGLFAPVELILIEEDDDQSSLMYVRPSSLMVVEPNAPLLAAALELDAKLQALAAKVTATESDGSQSFNANFLRRQADETESIESTN